MATLKGLERFEDSLIMVDSDHGRVTAAYEEALSAPLRNFIQMDVATSAAIREIDVRRQSGYGIEARYQALLLIKPPGLLTGQMI